MNGISEKNMDGSPEIIAEETPAEVFSEEPAKASDNTPEKKILHKIDIVTPDNFYLKPLVAGVGKYKRLLIELLHLVLAVESVIIMLMVQSPIKYIWIYLPIYYLFHLVKEYVIDPIKLRKFYNKVHSEGEDCITFSFYCDSVAGKTPATEYTLNYSDVEGWAEQDNKLCVLFSYGRYIFIDKAQCTAEQADFAKNIVPCPKQRRFERKNRLKYIITLIVCILLVAYCAVNIAVFNDARRNTYYVSCAGSTYDSFEACLEHGLVEDVLIINGTYVEYTFTGSGEDERYYTDCPDGEEQLIRLLEELDVEWESRDGVYLRPDNGNRFFK